MSDALKVDIKGSYSNYKINLVSYANIIPPVTDRPIDVYVDRFICIDDSGRPLEIDIDNWIKEGVIYTIESILKDTVHSDTVVVGLFEISTQNNKYTGYNMQRFQPYYFYSN